MIKLVIHGASGRMGTRVSSLAQRDERFRIEAMIGRERAAGHVEQRGDQRVLDADVIVDFSSDQGTRDALDLARRCGAALVVGTTGLSGQTLDVLGGSARSTPLIVAPNTALGVAVLKHLVAEAARLFGARGQVDILEQHHRHKRDAPSGTALALAAAIRDAGVDVTSDRVHSLRAGEIVGEHTVQFSGSGEIVRLEHFALSRDVFAAGALEAAAWLAGRPPGRYTIEQVLGLEPGA